MNGDKTRKRALVRDQEHGSRTALALPDGAVDLLTITLFRLSHGAVLSESCMRAGKVIVLMLNRHVKIYLHDLVLDTLEQPRRTNARTLQWIPISGQ